MRNYLDNGAHGVGEHVPARLQHDARPVDLRGENTAEVAQGLAQVHERPRAAGDGARLDEIRETEWKRRESGECWNRI